MKRYIFLPLPKKTTDKESLARFRVAEFSDQGVTTVYESAGEAERLSWLLSLTGDDEVYLAGGGYGVSSLLTGADLTSESLPQIRMCSTRQLKTLRDEKSGQPSAAETLHWLVELARGEPEVFVPLPRTELDIALLCASMRRWLRLQKLRVRVVNQLQADETAALLWSNSLAAAQMHEQAVWARAERERLEDWEAQAENNTKDLVKTSAYLTALFNLLMVPGIAYYLVGRFVADVVNIRRFPRWAGFKHYLGVFPHNGKLIQRSAGEMASYKPLSQSLFYLIGKQIERRPVGSSKYRIAYDAYKERTLPGHSLICSRAWCKKSPAGHVSQNARWHASSKLLFDWWVKWWEFAEPAGERRSA